MVKEIFKSWSPGFLKNYITLFRNTPRGRETLKAHSAGISFDSLNVFLGPIVCEIQGNVHTPSPSPKKEFYG